MSDDKRLPRSLDDLVGEAKVSLKPDSIDWEKVDSSLFARIERDASTENSGVRASHVSGKLTPRPEARGWQVAGLLAAAAAIAFVIHRPPSPERDARLAVATAHASSGVLTLTKNEGAGDVRIDGEIAAPGRALRALDSIETTSSRAELAATDVRAVATDNVTGLRVAWMLEDHSQATVRSLGGAGAPLILDLTSGSVEAQVTPVAQGEAFAVDLRAASASASPHEYVRIAVHGTHLRVTRDASGNHATIDLSEGVVSIGFPPKTGSTYGTLITAPAHVELDVAKFVADGGPDTGAIVVDKTATSVRAPIALASRDNVPYMQSTQDVGPTEGEPTDDHPDTHPTPTTDKAAPFLNPEADPHAEETIRAAARACAVVREKSNEVRVSVSSKLLLQVGTDGLVKMARFEPPLTPEAQECAGKTIYKTRFLPAAAQHEVSVDVDVDPAL